MSEILTKDDLVALLEYFSVPPRRLIIDYQTVKKQMRDACRKYEVEIPDWLKE